MGNLIRFYPRFWKANGEPATGLSLNDFQFTIIQVEIDWVNKRVKSVSLFADKEPFQAEIGYGKYAYFADIPDLVNFDYLALLDYVGSEDIIPKSLESPPFDVRVSSRTSLGPGAKIWGYTLTEEGTEIPIPDADVWITLDMAGQNVIAYSKTDQNGKCVFLLDPGTIYLWRQKTGWYFENPDVEVVE
jgi:hypothetical protein